LQQGASELVGAGVDIDNHLAFGLWQGQDWWCKERLPHVVEGREGCAGRLWSVWRDLRAGHCVERLCSFSEVFDEKSIDIAHPQEAFELSLGSEERSVLQRVDVHIMNMELTRSDNESKVLDFVEEPGAFLKMESDTGFTQPRQDHINVLDVLLCRSEMMTSSR